MAKTYACNTATISSRLGSKHSPADVDVPAVQEELAFVARAVSAGIPVLGLCYGGQVLATVLAEKLCKFLSVRVGPTGRGD